MERQDLAEKLARELEGMGFDYESMLNEIKDNLTTEALEEWDAGKLVLANFRKNDDDIPSVCPRCERDIRVRGRRVELVDKAEDDVLWVFCEPWDYPDYLLCPPCRRERWREEKEKLAERARAGAEAFLAEFFDERDERQEEDE